MYCRVCGNQHGGEVNYCPAEGSIAAVASVTAVLEQDYSKYCRGCGGENGQRSLYCQTCGHSLLLVKKKEYNGNESSRDIIPKVKLSLNKSGLRSGIIGGAVASICLLIAGWLGSFVFAEMMGKIFHQFAREFEMLPAFYSETTSILLSYHLLGFTAGDAGGDFLTLSWHTPFFLLLIIPFIILSGTGIWLGKQRVANTIGEQVAIAGTVGIIYGFFLFIISFVAAKSITLPEVGAVTAGYSSFKSLWSGFMCGMLFSLFGLIVHKSRNHVAEAFQELLPYGAALYYGAAAMVKGLLLTAVILLVTALTSNLDSLKPLKELASTSTQRVMLTLQLTPHVWGMTHLAPLEIQSPVVTKKFSKQTKTVDENALQLSFTSGMSFNGTKIRDLAVAERASLGTVKEMDDVNSKFHFGLLLLIIPLFFMFRAGQKLAKMPSSNVYVTLAVCSGAYTILMVIMNSLSKFQINISGGMTGLFGMNGTLLSMQNSLAYLILGSFILTYVAAFVGMKLVRK